MKIDGGAIGFALASIAYPLAAAGLMRWAGPENGPWAALALLGAILAFRLLWPRGPKAPDLMIAAAMTAAGLTAMAAALDPGLAARLYPAIMNGVMLTAFAGTLLRPPSMIERFARILEPDLPPEGVRYTRNVTFVWCLFFAVNGAIALWTALGPDIGFWALYNGVIAYAAMGVLFGGEFLLRGLIRKQAGAAR